MTCKFVALNWPFRSLSFVDLNLLLIGRHSNLSIQYILNCGTEEAGSCHGGYHTSTYEFIKKVGYVPYDTCQPYIACSAESTEGEF